MGSAFVLLADRAFLFAGGVVSLTDCTVTLGTFSFLGGAGLTGDIGFLGTGTLELLRGSAGYSCFLGEDLDADLFLGDGFATFTGVLDLTSALDTDFFADFLPGDFLGDYLRGDFVFGTTGSGSASSATGTSAWASCSGSPSWTSISGSTGSASCADSSKACSSTYIGSSKG